MTKPRGTVCVLLLSLQMAVGCSASKQNGVASSNQTTKSPSKTSGKIVSISGGGVLKLHDAREFKLAGIQMYTDDQTLWSDGASKAVTIINSATQEQTIEMDDGSELAVAYYDQPVLFRDKGIPPGFLNWVVSPKTHRGTVNELLIYLGLAKYSNSASLPPALARKQEMAQRKYDQARARGHRHEPLPECVRRPELLYWSGSNEGYRANLNLRDYLEWKRNREVTQ